MKLLSAIVLASAVAVSGAAIAKPAKISNPTVAKKSVTYGFNKQGLTTSASAVVDGKRRFMPIDLDRSDNADTYYGKEGGYVLSTAYMDKKTYRKQPIMITAPDDEIVLKDCSPR